MIGAMGFTLALLLPTGALASTPAQALAKCAAGPTYLPDTCACLQREIPNVHLTGKLEGGACPFQIPPPSFDPSRAPADVLESWGIPQTDARELSNPEVRKAYFHGVVREYHGQGCCGPGLGTTWRPSDGAKCDLRGGLFIHCIQFHTVIPVPGWRRAGARTPP